MLCLTFHRYPYTFKSQNIILKANVSSDDDFDNYVDVDDHDVDVDEDDNDDQADMTCTIRKHNVSYSYDLQDFSFYLKVHGIYR